MPTSQINCGSEPLNLEIEDGVLEFLIDKRSKGIPVDNRDTLEQIEMVSLKILRDISTDEGPTLSYSNRNTWQNVRFTTEKGVEMTQNSTSTCVRFDSIHSVNKFTMMMKLLAVIYDLVQSGRYSTKRDIFYQDPEMYGSQSYLDNLLHDISCMLKVPRWRLHVFATSKGYLAGDLDYTEYDGNFVDCRDSGSGVLVPSHVEGIKNLHSTAKVILVIEKDATFQKVLDDGILSRLKPCILITGKGVPDLNTRLMVRKLWDTFQTPTLALVDADPHGIEIMSVYKYGSLSMSFDAGNLTVPSIKWLGVLPSDIDRLNLPQEVLLPLGRSDLDKAKDLLNRPYFAYHADWKKELELMLHLGKKAEIQSLTAVSPSYLTNVYIPNKIQFGGWI